MVLEVSSEQPRSHFYIYAYRVLLPLLLLLLCVLLYRCCCCNSSAADSCCCSLSCAGWPNLVLVHWIWPQCFLSPHLNANLFLVYPLAVLYRIYGRDFPTFSAIAGTRGTKTGVSPLRQSPLCIRHSTSCERCDMMLHYLTWCEGMLLRYYCHTNHTHKKMVKKRLLSCVYDIKYKKQQKWYEIRSIRGITEQEPRNKMRNEIYIR